ncbi:MarR family winged helix-turn-helix transcriptional regulator [uncultured Jatrophihabitans sp.]|uniref:MarR family winged helix-turn-helix transcriptional regulator n=1 Tax=uncultured Jatrophihabitans sp. TaxID=1610747 RepID=UPI0035C96DF9
MMIAEEDIVRLRIALGRIARQVDRQVAGDGMTRSQLSVLGSVARAKSVRMSELADVEGVNPTMLSRIVGKLEAQGLVLRSQLADDRRGVSVAITADGARLHSRLRRQRTKLFAERLAGLPDEHVAALAHAVPALESLAEAMLAAVRPADALVGR